MKRKEKMKRSIVFALVAAAAVSASAEAKIGVVNMLTLVRNHPNYDSNKELLTSTDKDYKRKLDEIKAEGESLQEDGKKLAEQVRNPMLAAKAKADVEKKLMDIQQKLMGIEQRYRNEAVRCRQDLQDLEGRLLKATSEDIRKRIAKFAGENGYDLVLDTSAALFSKDEYDVTDEILKSMNVDPKTAKGRDEGK